MATPPNEMDVWVLAGQSNMEGCGLLRGALTADENVWNFSMDGTWNHAQEPLHALWESYAPVHANFMRLHLSEEDAGLTNEELAQRHRATRDHGAGLGISFANEWSRATGRPTGLIAAAHGGTSLNQWSQDKKDEGLDSLYGAMLDRIERAGGNFKGILWYQGESDCNPNDGPTYAARFDAWVNAVRKDTGRPDLPVFVVQLSRYVVPVESAEIGPSWNTVREAQRTLPDRTPHTGVAGAIDLDLDDAIHVGTHGLIRLGRRLANLALAHSQGQSAGPQLQSVQARRAWAGLDLIQLRFSGVTTWWQPIQHISGFSLHTKAGEIHPTLRPVNAFADASDPSTINVLLNGPVDGDIAIAYGRGLNPYCNAVDGADMPLLTFAPVAVQPVAG